jgi:hypothetical protein
MRVVHLNLIVLIELEIILNIIDKLILSPFEIVSNHDLYISLHKLTSSQESEAVVVGPQFHVDTLGVKPNLQSVKLCLLFLANITWESRIHMNNLLSLRSAPH